MKISYQLLNEYIDLKNADPHAIAPAIAEHCFEVEFIHAIGSATLPAFTNVFAAEVLHVEKHPNADRLRVVRLNLGDRIIDPVVCGAFNFEAGDMVALALPGAWIPQNVHSDAHEAFELGSAKIRGVESKGMICSAFELALRDTPEEKPEIMILPGSIKPGTDLKEYFTKQAQESGTNDYLLDFAMPANRPDLHSHIGVAQELSGMLGYKKTKLMQQSQQSLADAKPLKYSPKASIKVSLESTVCSMYLGARMRVIVGATPEALLAPLRTLGHNGVNNVVDITNFVMVETGQPMHAYDAAIVDGGITVRAATADEKVLGLDGKEYTLPTTAVVIADDKKALGIAGIIGGNESKIIPQTQEIILEAALFDRVAIRRASKAVGLRTDASGLFEKGTTQQQALFAFQRAVQLLEQYAEGSVIEYFGSPVPAAAKSRTVSFTTMQINEILGGSFSESEIKKILSGLGIVTEGSKKLTARIPWYRQDIEDAAGLADEVVRSIGMNIIPRQPLQLQRANRQYNREESIWQAKDAAVGLGYREVQGYSFISGAEIAAAGRDIETFIKISNPLSLETEYLRHDLGEGLLKIAAANAKHSEQFKLFEIGFGYHGYDQEKLLIAFAVYRKNLSSEAVVAELKGDIQAFLRSLGISKELQFKQDANGQNIAFLEDVGAIAVIDPANDLPKRFDLGHELVICQLQLDPLFALARPSVFHAFSRFPKSAMDLSIVVAEGQQWSEIEDIIRKNSGTLLQNIEMLDAPYMYAAGKESSFHKNLAKEGRKNLVFRLVFGTETGTLQDSEISEIYAKIKVDLQKKISAEIR